jgi:hypothetical protein
MYSPVYPRPRKVYFNWVDSAGQWFSNGIGDNVFPDSVTGYCQVAMPPNGNRGVIAAMLEPIFLRKSQSIRIRRFWYF